MSEKTHGYWLPSQDGTREDHETESNSVIIIGANGSGKSKLGAWMEQQDFERVHRIASQRNLNFSEHIPLQSYAEAEGTVFYGSAEPSHQRQKGVRWNWSKSYTTTLLNDFDPVLAALIAKYGNEAQNYFEAARAAEKAGTDKPQTQDSTLDKLYDIMGNHVKPNDAQTAMIVDAWSADGRQAVEHVGTYGELVASFVIVPAGHPARQRPTSNRTSRRHHIAPFGAALARPTRMGSTSCRGAAT